MIHRTAPDSELNSPEFDDWWVKSGTDGATFVGELQPFFLTYQEDSNLALAEAVWPDMCNGDGALAQPPEIASIQETALKSGFGWALSPLTSGCTRFGWP